MGGNTELLHGLQLSLRSDQVLVTVGNSSQDDSDEEIRRVRRQLHLLTDSNEDWSDPPFDTSSVDSSASSRSAVMYLNERYIDDEVEVPVSLRRYSSVSEDGEDVRAVVGDLERGIGDGVAEGENDSDNINDSSTEDQVVEVVDREGMSYGNDMGGGNLSFDGPHDPAVGLDLDEEEYDPIQDCSVGGVERVGLEEDDSSCAGEKSALSGN